MTYPELVEILSVKFKEAARPLNAGSGAARGFNSLGWR
jgi:hypothetical protein